MAVVIYEKLKSRSGRASPEDPSIQIVYQVVGTMDETVVDCTVCDMTPTTWNSLTRQGWTRDFVGPGDGGIWDVTVDYNRNDPRGPGSVQFEGDISAGTQHITMSLATVDAEVNPSTVTWANPVDYKGAIGVTDTDVEGVDTHSRKMEFVIRVIYAKDAIPGNYLDTLRSYVGTVNDHTFVVSYQGQTLQFEEAELLFLGGPYKYRGDGSWEFNFRFAMSPTTFNLNIGGTYTPGDLEPAGGIVIAEKKGWDYLWVRFKQDTDPTNNSARKVPIQANVEQVYPRMDFDEVFDGILNFDGQDLSSAWCAC